MERVHRGKGAEPARAERLHRWMPPALLILVVTGLIACAAFGAPLVAILVVGLLLIVPLLTWGPVRTAHHPEERSGT